jgi:endonuclease YncB( thermonuclease family)
MTRRHLAVPLRRVFMILVAASLLADLAAKAQTRRFSRATGTSECQLQSGGESTVLAIAGPQTLHLADGRFVRLSEIIVPAAVPLGFDASAAAMAYLRETALGRKIEVKFGGAQRDRYGVYAGHVYVAGEPAVWLQEGLVSSGAAQVFPQPDNHACARQLLAFESTARRENRGHWGLAYFKVLQTRDPRSILNLVQTYQIVEGKTTKATESGERLTLHFGEQNRFGFIAVIEPGARKRFADKPAPENWEGLALRIRGWVERKRGPSIPITQAEQIEFLAQNSDDSRPEREGAR